MRFPTPNAVAADADCNCSTRRRSARNPSTSSTTNKPANSGSPQTSVAAARIVPGEPSGSCTTKCNDPFNRLNPVAANNWPDKGCVNATTRTSVGSTERK